MSNYPMGVDDSHPHFNQSTTTAEVRCEREEATVIPAVFTQAMLDDLDTLVERGRRFPTREGYLTDRIEGFRKRLKTMEQEREYECSYEGEVEVEVREDAEWTCPLCGATHTINSLPEGPDPDRAWDERHGN